MTLRVRRVHEPPQRSDGVRILVDRLWPRGVSKERAAIERWAREVAPSDALRKWFGHDPARWDGFRERYFRELDALPDAVQALADEVVGRNATLLFGTREERFNNAVALREYLAATFRL